MTSRERVLQTLEHIEPDQVPSSLGGSAHKLSTRNFFKLLDYLELDKAKAYKELTGYKFSWYHNELWNRLGVDVMYIHMKPPISLNRWDPLNSLREWGIICEEESGWIHYPEYPLRDVPYYKLLNKLDLPTGLAKERLQGLKAQAEKLYNKTNFAIAAYRPVPLGIFELSQALCGMGTVLKSFYLKPDFVNILFQQLLHSQMKFYELMLHEVGEFVHIVEIIDDLGGQDNPLISPDLYREFLKPIHAKLITSIKAKAPHVKILLHSCGSVEPFIRDFIDIGVDILNPVQPLAAKMNTTKLKEKYGDKICFEGAIDVQKALRGTSRDVQREIRQRVEDLSAGGGYILAPSHNLDDEVPLENIITLFKEVPKRRGIFSR